jgi:hypothetical protein
MSANSSRVRCPYCQAELPSPAGQPSRPARRRWPVGLVVLGVLLVGCLVLGYRYRGQFTTILLLANELTGSSALSVALLGAGALAAVCLAGWLLLPWFLAWAYLDLRRRLPAPLPDRPCDAARSSGPSPPPAPG